MSRDRITLYFLGLFLMGGFLNLSANFLGSSNLKYEYKFRKHRNKTENDQRKKRILMNETQEAIYNSVLESKDLQMEGFDSFKKENLESGKEKVSNFEGEDSFLEENHISDITIKNLPVESNEVSCNVELENSLLQEKKSSKIENVEKETSKIEKFELENFENELSKTENFEKDNLQSKQDLKILSEDLHSTQNNSRKPLHIRSLKSDNSNILSNNNLPLNTLNNRFLFDLRNADSNIIKILQIRLALQDFLNLIASGHEKNSKETLDEIILLLKNDNLPEDLKKIIFNFYNAIKNLKDPKNHHVRELEKICRKLNLTVSVKLFDKKLSAEQKIVLEQLYEFSKFLLAILTNTEDLDSPWDKILDMVFFRLKDTLSNNKKITSTAILTLLGAISILLFKHYFKRNIIPNNVPRVDEGNNIPENLKRSIVKPEYIEQNDEDIGFGQDEENFVLGNNFVNNHRRRRTQYEMFVDWNKEFCDGKEWKISECWPEVCEHCLRLTGERSGRE